MSRDDMIMEGVLDVWRAVLAAVQALQVSAVRLKRLTSKLVSFSQNRSSGTILGPSTSTTPPFAGAAGAGEGVQYSRVVPRVSCSALITPSASCFITGIFSGMSLYHDQVFRKNI